MNHYNEDYFNWQKNIGAFGGMANLFKFNNHINKKSKIIDFGSGGGYLLANINCEEKIGIEINPHARKMANELGINTFSSADKIDDNWADLIISNHALEHVENPLMILKTLYQKLKINGKIVFVVPYEKKVPYKHGDINFHLFTWSEMNLGNLFSLAGFEVIKVSELKHKWPPGFMKIRKYFGDNLFNIICRLYGTISSNTSQVKIVAKKTTHNNV